jgi:hypothetical protein
MKSFKPPYGKRFFSCGNLSFGGKNGTGSRGANNASKFGGKNCVIFNSNKTIEKSRKYQQNQCYRCCFSFPNCC